MPPEADAASSCWDDHENLSAKGAWPKTRSTHEGSVCQLLRESRGISKVTSNKTTLLILPAYFSRIIYFCPFPRKINFHFPGQLNRDPSWKLKISNVLIGPHHLFSCCQALLVLQFHSESVFLSHKPHNQQSVLWSFPTLTFPDFLIQSTSALGWN